MSTDLNVIIRETRGDLAAAAVRGVMDLHTTPALHEQAAGLLNTHRELVLDLSSVAFCDSSGLNTLLRLHRHARATGGTLALACIPDQVMRLLTLTGASSVLDLFTTTDEALTALSDPRTSP
ncbi:MULTISPECIES: STAS domain-containing protein [Streptomyces]|uniref:STAS domain-containing protein n=1 Tax=Streptomyces herbicida TaxID=3065675 RepID=UPI0029302B77|nr:STAS domain-containing protein [Streptomyces sp. NEAU-HV9]